MRYFGSKVSTLEAIHDLVSQRVSSGTFCDPFGGIGSVGSFFKSKGYSVWSGDILNFAHFFQISRLGFNQAFLSPKVANRLGFECLNDLLDYLNSLVSKPGWFVREYSEKRKFFTRTNAIKVQSVWRKIINWNNAGLLSHEERAILLASLINSMDRVANTAGTYYAYLKKWHRKAKTNFKFELLQPAIGGNNGMCFLEPAYSLVKRKNFDILYLDPPYNERSYAHYYHLPETIALGKTPKVHGMSGIPLNIKNISKFNRPREAENALVDLLDGSHFKMLVFHYSDNGIIPPTKVREVLSSYGEIEDFLLDSKGYTTKTRQRKIKHHLYLVRNA